MSRVNCHSVKQLVKYSSSDASIILSTGKKPSGRSEKPQNTVKLRYNKLLGIVVKGQLYPKSVTSKLGYGQAITKTGS